jgi:hypothetical protein
MMRVFISHSRINKRRALRIASAVLDLGVQVWYDEWDILVGHNLADQIYAGIASSDYVLILLTRASVQSRWVKEELDFAKTQEIERRGTILVPLLCEDCEIPPALRSKVYADFRSSFDSGVRQLTGLFRSALKTLGAEALRSIESDIIMPLRCHKMITDLLGETVARYSLEGDARREADEYLAQKITRLKSFAEQFGVDPKYYTALLVELPQKHDNTTDAFNLWFKGICLYSGGMLRKLPDTYQIAFDIGRSLGHFDERLAWIKDFRRDYTVLGFSDRFFRFLDKKSVSLEQIQDALAVELSRIHDYAHLRLFSLRKQQSQGIASGFECVYALYYEGLGIDVPAGLTLSLCAEFILSELDGYEQALGVLQMALELTHEKGMANLKKHPMELYGGLVAFAVSIAHQNIAARAFLLGLSLGILMMTGNKKVPGGLPQEIYVLVDQLNLSEMLHKSLQDVVDQVFYERSGLERIPELVEELSDSFRSGSSGVSPTSVRVER